ncbi:MAG: hypothetical protein QOF58_2786 [Pseudonocardiales bacterium]|nr:hypothetical protein [Pseudonocardiales bacterium]
MPVDLWEAWRLWITGTSMQQVVLWGMPLVWWGRAGKAAQFLAGLVALLDIIGPVRLRTWAGGSAGSRWPGCASCGCSPHSTPWRDFRQHWFSGIPIRGLSSSAQGARALRQIREQEEFRKRYRVSETVESIVLFAIAGFILAGLIDNRLIDWTVDTVLDHPWLVVFVPPHLRPGLRVLCRLAARRGVRVRRAAPLAWLLDRENPGFHFDLPAS